MNQRDTPPVLPTVYSLGRSETWIEIVKRLSDTLGWKPSYWIVNSLDKEVLASNFPETVLHEFADLNRCISSEGSVAFPEICLDHDLMKSFAVTEQRIMELMDRMSLAESFETRARRTAYQWYLHHWHSVVLKRGIKMCVFNAPPHSPADLVLHDVCVAHEIPVRMITPTQLLGRHLVLPHFAQSAPALKHHYTRRRATGDTNISPEMSELLSGITAPRKEDPWYINQVREREDRKVVLRQKIETILDADPDFNLPLVMDPKPEAENVLVKSKHNLSPERLANRAQPIRKIFKQPGKPLRAPKLTKGAYSDYQTWAYLQKIRLQRAYEENAKLPDTGKPFVLLALHYQPERTSCPDAESYSDQFLVAQLLSQSLPRGWQLLIKEHPSQFSFGGEGEMSRREEDYVRLVELPRTELVSMNVRTSDLLDETKAVATLTGFVGVEASLRGIPVLVFGNAWYRDCESVHYIRGPQACHDALEAIAAGRVPDPDDVRAFIGALEDAGEICYGNASFQAGVNVSEEEQVERVVALLTDFEKLKQKDSQI